MKPSPHQASSDAACEFMVLPDGTLLAHQLTPALAAVLAQVNPADATMRQRAAGAAKPSEKRPKAKVQFQENVRPHPEALHEPRRRRREESHTFTNQQNQRLSRLAGSSPTVQGFKARIASGKPLPQEREKNSPPHRQYARPEMTSNPLVEPEHRGGRQKRGRVFKKRSTAFPSPGGEGQGEGGPTTDHPHNGKTV
jgi:hypothetical protein